VPYEYAPDADERDPLIWRDDMQASLKDYNLMDLSI
jgi:hypothetical protein